MANQFGGLSWSIDTAITVPIAVGAVQIKALKWESADAQNGDTISVMDGLGNRLWANAAQGPQWDTGLVQFDPPLKSLTGITVAFATSSGGNGVLYVYLL